MYATRTRRHDGDRPDTVPLSHRIPRPRVSSLGNYHIHKSQVSGVTQDIRSARIGRFNLMILTEVKITNQTYFHNRMVYVVVFLKKTITTAYGNV